MAASSVCLDGRYISLVNNTIAQLVNSSKYGVIDQDQLTSLLDDLIIQLNESKKKEVEVNYDTQAFVEICLHLLNLVHSKESFKVAKVCQIWEHVFQMPNVALDARGSDRFLSWISHTLQHSDDLIYIDILNCIAFSVILKEIKHSKLLESILQPTGLLVRRLEQSMEITTEKLSFLQILCNFALCPGERDWSSVPRDLVKVCIKQFCDYLENLCSSASSNLLVLKALILCFHGLENVFVRFHSSAVPNLGRILGLCKCYILYGVAGYTAQYSQLMPCQIPFMESPCKNDQGKKTPKLRKKKASKNMSKSRAPSTRDEDGADDFDSPAAPYQVKMKSWKSGASSSDSELEDPPGQLSRQREYQAKVRASSLKTLTAAFKFCDRKSVVGYWSAFLPDSSQSHVFRHSLMTPILKDSSTKVRCNALNGLATLLQILQPTLAMASYQQKQSGAFIPFSQTVAETAVTVQRSLLLSLSAEQSNAAFIQLFKCLAVAASVFPYEKLPAELVTKTVKQCRPFLDFKDPDVKVACMSLLRVLLCTQHTNEEVVAVFWDSGQSKCWLLEHCMSVVTGHCGFSLTLESLLVLGQVSRWHLRLARPYIGRVVHSICDKMIVDDDVGIQIRCAKALALVCSSILQEMDKDEAEQVITRDEAVQLWVEILRRGLPDVLQSGSTSPLRAEACAALATIGSQIFECLPRDLRILFATLSLGCAADADTGVRAAAVRTLGFAVTFNTLNDDPSFILDCSEVILNLLKDSNVLVALNASWALGNLADTLEKNKSVLEEELPVQFITDLIPAVCQAAQGPVKVRGNGVRALGILLKLVGQVNVENAGTVLLLEEAVSVIVKQVTTGSLMKNRWNACYAVGNILQNVRLLTAFPHWMDKLVDSLLLVFSSCGNFKVRISAANAMLHLNCRQLLSANYTRIWQVLLSCLASCEQIDDFSEFQHHETMCRQICNTLCRMMTLATKEDLSNLHEILIKYYDVCLVHFEKYSKSLLPDQLEMVLEASNYVKQAVSPSLTSSQRSALELFNELLRIPC